MTLVQFFGAIAKLSGLQNFTDPNVLTTLLVGAILLLLLLMSTARQLGSRAKALTPAAEPGAEPSTDPGAKSAAGA